MCSMLADEQALHDRLFADGAACVEWMRGQSDSVPRVWRAMILSAVFTRKPNETTSSFYGRISKCIK